MNRRSEVESELCVPGRLLRGSVGRGVRPSQAAARGAGESRSVGSPESGRAAWPVAERVGQVGHPFPLLSGRGGSVGRKILA